MNNKKEMARVNINKKRLCERANCLLKTTKEKAFL